jgi:aspartate kinase
MVPPTDPPTLLSAGSVAASVAGSVADPATPPVVSKQVDGPGGAPLGPIVVQKYGGSSVADVARIRAVARRVVAGVAAGQRVVVVVSAMGNTTNELLALARAVSERPGRRELDLLVSVGERVSMTLLAMAIEDLGIPAASFTGSQSGIITDERHVAARVVEVRPWRVQAALDAGRVAIVAGFQGVSRAGEVTTLGRGGSDTTAVVLAAALRAEWCEICSDVDGVWSADPRVVPGARRIENLPLDAAIALARGGAKVLLAEALERAREWGVVLQASATENPPGTGTRLVPGAVERACLGVAADGQLIEVRGRRSDLGGLPNGALVASMMVGGELWAYLDSRNLGELPPGARLVASVTLVGRAIATEASLQDRAVRVLETGGIEPQATWAQGESWSALIERSELAEAQRLLHRAFIEDAAT